MTWGNVLTSLSLEYDVEFLLELSNDPHRALRTGTQMTSAPLDQSSQSSPECIHSLIQQHDKRHPGLESVAVPKGLINLTCWELQIIVTQRPWGRDEQYYLSATGSSYRVDFL